MTICVPPDDKIPTGGPGKAPGPACFEHTACL
jgi:hypothetical protein